VIRLAVRVQAAQAELALAELLELAPGGVEEVELPDGSVEYAVYGAPGELPDLPDLKAAAGAGLVEVSSSQVPEDWQERWRRFHRPVRIASPAPARAPDLWVRPPWEAPRGAHASTDPDAGATVEIVIDPGQAFGTGGHATTRLCLELLLGLAASDPTRGALLDVGTGSGVLAIAAAKLGYAPVLALDNDRRSVQATTQNARVNRASVQVRELDIRAEPPPFPDPSRAPAGPRGFAATVLTANLLRPLLLDLARSMLQAPSHLLAGGLLVEEVDEVVEAFARRLDLRERERREQGAWAAVWMQSARPDQTGCQTDLAARAGSGSSVAARTVAR
jgi:ribosomal protein L11 methyltransferase